jgi:ferredoxin--NADP+ reductase
MADWQESRVIDKTRWNDSLFSLTFDTELLPFKAGQFIKVGLEVDGERVERPYSLVNAPQESPGEIYFNLVEEGPLTNELAAIKPGDPIWVTRDAHGFLILDEVPEAKHLWLMATGTGLGPFLSMLTSGEPAERFEKIVLVHGVRYEADLSYQDRIASIADEIDGKLTYIPVVSREKQGNALNGRITHLIESGDLEQSAGLQLNPDESHVMLCGNIAMIRDVIALLEPRGMKKHKRFDPGHIMMEKYH